MRDIVCCQLGVFNSPVGVCWVPLKGRSSKKNQKKKPIKSTYRHINWWIVWENITLACRSTLPTLGRARCGWEANLPLDSLFGIRRRSSLHIVLKMKKTITNVLRNKPYASAQFQKVLQWILKTRVKLKSNWKIIQYLCLSLRIRTWDQTRSLSIYIKSAWGNLPQSLTRTHQMQSAWS